MVRIQIIILIAASNLLIGQNLVPNNSFEYHNSCPDKSTFNEASNALAKTGWENLFVYSGCYFAEQCNNSPTPSNIYGYQIPKDGTSYVNLIFFKPNNASSPVMGKYLICKLTEPLVEGEKYSIGFYVSLCESSQFQISNLGIYLSEDRPYQKQDHGYIKHNGKYIVPQIINHTDSFISDTVNWVLIGGEYIAAGGENFLTIGNFHTSNTIFLKNNNARKISNPSTSFSAYYIDAVFVIPLDTINFYTLLKNQTIKINHLYFASDSFNILQKNCYQLNRLVTYLKANPNLKIIVEGHTDNVGNELSNNQLSLRRAKSVKEYLVSSGISPNRINVKGVGSSMPVGDNNTKEGRRKNRRIEIKIF
jgi:outer membrane protein OmpA-like peptidoglycan-associated protein